MLLVTVALVVVQEMSARLGAFTGEGLMSLIREHFSLRAATFAIVCLVVANLGLVVSEFAGIGAAFELFGVSRYLSIPIAALAIWATVVFGNYRYAERVFLLLGLAFIAYPIAGHPGRPGLGGGGPEPRRAELRGRQRLPLHRRRRLIGTTITPYMQLYQAAAVAERGMGADDYNMVRVDTVVGSIMANLVSIAIIIATAATIGGTGPLGSAADAARALEPVAGARAEVLSASACSGPRPWPARSSPCPPRTRWPRSSASSGRSRARSGRRRCSSGSSPA